MIEAGVANVVAGVVVGLVVGSVIMIFEGFFLRDPTDKFIVSTAGGLVIVVVLAGLLLLPLFQALARRHRE